MTSWLHRQRKGTILDLSREAGLKADEDTRKDDLIDALDAHLQQNSFTLSRNPAFEQYYGTRRTPAAPRTSTANATGSNGAGATSDSGETKSVVKARGRKPTQVKDEVDSDGPVSPLQTVTAAVSSLVERTPAAAAAVRRRSELLPASPADVAEDMEIAATRFSSNLGRIYVRSGVPAAIESLRQRCSSALAVQAGIIFLEALSLSSHVMPFKFAFDIPAPAFLTPTDSKIAFKLPDLFMLLTGYFWSTTLLWATTNFFLPLAAAYIFNLSTKDVKRHGTRVTVWRHNYDPMVFNIAKALTTYVVYARGARFYGLLNSAAVFEVNRAMLGGHTGVLIGCGVGILVSLYEAAQTK